MELELDLTLKAKLEALLVAADRPVAESALARSLEVGQSEVAKALDAIDADTMAVDRGFQLHRKHGNVRIEVKTPYVDLVGKLFPERRNKPLSNPAVEVLAIVALKQPITTPEITAIRGVDSSAVVESLHERGLLTRQSRRGANRAWKWQTTQRFLDLFHLASVDDLYNEEVCEESFASLAGSEEEE